MNVKIMITAAALTTAAGTAFGSTPLTYPAAPADPVTDKYFDIEVIDTYRPLENDTAAATKQWVEAENKVTRDYLDAIPFRGAIKQRLSQLMDYRKTGLPWRAKDGRYYFYENDGLKNQAVLFRKDSIDGEATVFLDPNRLSDNGTVALTGTSFSDDGRYMAYTVSRNGSDWTEIYVMDTRTGQLLPDHIKWAKFTGAEWMGDGFLYSAYPIPEDGKEFSNANANHRVYFHKLGTPQSDDTVFYEDSANPYYFHSAEIADKGKVAFITVAGQGVGNALLMKDMTIGNSPWIAVEPTQNYEFEVVKVKDGVAYAKTTKDAPRGKVVKFNVADPSVMTDFIPETESVLTSVIFTPEKLLLAYQKDASSHAFIHNLDGRFESEIKFPTYGSVSFSASDKYPEVFYSFTSFVYPSAQYSLDTATGVSRLIGQAKVNGLNPDDYVTEQVFYTSADGTKVPMFITYKKGLKKDGDNPVYLYGYGGFNISLPPSFSPYLLYFMEQGGIYAQANLRGGSEYGEEWHAQGTKMQKMNVFNDFIAAAEYLIDQNWTNKDLLTISGGSNGGLLVGATTNLRPDLFKVAIPRVGVMDMMRYHLFTIGWNWAPDYGTSADSPEMAAYLLSYSPVHTIRNDGTPYPAILVTTADHDDRVVPAHSFKYAATLQAANTGDNPKLIRIDSNAGHGAGKPVSKTLDEWTDMYAFIFKNIGRTPAE
ncbi:MAG: prolyl oligopeptidase family serine peptidase [Muribaculaceae bacterium]|nr:prolyl oligopeptidase family serine peptidase [Muribaculaceae bacterium]